MHVLLKENPIFLPFLLAKGSLHLFKLHNLPITSPFFVRFQSRLVDTRGFLLH